MKRLLIVNHATTRVCGVHGLGRRIHANLNASKKLRVFYAECAGAANYRQAVADCSPDVALFVYSGFLMPWVPEAIGPHPPIRIAIPMNYEPVDATMAAHADLFDYLMILDSALETDVPRVFTVGRALPPGMARGDTALHDPPWVGSFGFAFGHKGFHTLAGVLADEFPEGVRYNLHMPEAYFNGGMGYTGIPLHTDNILTAARDLIAGRPVAIFHTDDYVEDDADIVARLASNDINALWYHPGQGNPGLASSLDYLIAAQRPILLTDATNFNGFTRPGMTWPATTFRDILADYPAHCRMAEALYRETAGRFVTDVERVIAAVL